MLSWNEKISNFIYFLYLRKIETDKILSRISEAFCRIYYKLLCFLCLYIKYTIIKMTK